MKIKIAKHFPNGRMLHVDQARNGKLCNCVCVECKEQLLAAQGPIQDSHYKHIKNVMCKGAQMTALHKLGQQIIAEHTNMIIGQNRILNYGEVKLEPSIGLYRADARFLCEGEEYFCEVVVKNELTMEKELYYRSTNRKCIEIDLTEFVDKDYTYEEIKDAMLTKISNKRLIQKITTRSNDAGADFLKVAFFLVLAFFGLRALMRRL